MLALADSKPMHAPSPFARAALASPGEARAPDGLDALLLRHFGLPALRGFQREAIQALLGGRGRVLLVAPTGGGKSLCYQLPAVALRGTVLVLSPLISLMDDQVRALAARGIPATFLASTLPREESAKRLAGLRRGELKVVYAAPERLAYDGFLDTLEASDLSLVAIDEAHCIVQWGHDFRPDYLKIGEALRRLRPPRVLACTATATPGSRAEILRCLGWDERDTTVILRGFARPNLHLAVREVGGPRDAAAEAASALSDALGSAREPSGAGIVYAATRRGAETMAEKLRERGFPAEAYHAGLDAEVRTRVSAAFAERRLPVVVATNAFGMGIDRPDVRIVVHAQPPSSIEAYYQEVGRAGRDGQPARGLLLHSGVDITLRRRLIELGEGGAPARPEEAARAWALFRELLRYVDASTCRHDFILRYFGDEAESLGGCGHCDVCHEVDQREASDPAKIEADRGVIIRALAGVARAKGSAGMQAIAAMLAGRITERVTSLGLDRLSTFGVLAAKTPEENLVVLRVLLANGWIDFGATELPIPVLTPLGWKVMKGEQPVRACLPPARSRAPRARSARSARPSRSPRPAAKGGEGASRPAPPDRRMTIDEAVAQGMSRAVYDDLRAVRARIAREQSVPAYVIAPERTLMELAIFQPRSREELRLAHGMGPARIESYGDAFLAALGHPSI
ncbi:MAG: ATP-dependent DNA helicase RecQ [Byssovorax sp.]